METLKKNKEGIEGIWKLKEEPEFWGQIYEDGKLIGQGRHMVDLVKRHNALIRKLHKEKKNIHELYM
jgi:hypothetical protein